MGNGVTNQLAHQFPDSLLGIHFNGVGVPPPPEAEQTQEEREWVRTVNAFVAVERDYYNEQQHKPETVAFALTDNPLGTAAWIAEKLKIWSDSPNDLEPVFTKDQVLTNIMIYLVTDTIGTSVWFYRGRVDEPSNLTGKVNVPTGIRLFSPRVADPGSSPKRDRAKFQFGPVHKNAARRTFRLLGTTGIASGRPAQFFPKIAKLNNRETRMSYLFSC